MKNTLWQNIALLVVIAILGYILGHYVASKMSPHSIVEGARTLPRPTRHPLPTQAYIRQPGPDYNGQTMNDYVDQLIGTYFDDNNVPYTNTINLYSLYCVNQGNVDPAIKNKLNDVCYYILNIVIPNIPDETNPNPSTVWPKIEWLSTSVFPPIINTTNPGLMYSNTWNSYSYLYNNSAANGGYNYGGAGPGTATTPATSTNGSGNGTGAGGCGSNGNPCGIQCPTSCFLTALTGSATGNTGSSTSSIRGANNYTINANASYSGALSEATRLSTSHTNSVIVGGQIQYYEITDASQNYPNTSRPLNFGITLNDNIQQNILDKYFITSGPNAGRPTQYAIDQFTQIWLSNPYPMDVFHKNKLRDLVYYVMEYILPGLPTSALPVSYVEWRPIQWLSHSTQ